MYVYNSCYWVCDNKRRDNKDNKSLPWKNNNCDGITDQPRPAHKHHQDCHAARELEYCKIVNIEISRYLLCQAGWKSQYTQPPFRKIILFLFYQIARVIHEEIYNDMLYVDRQLGGTDYWYGLTLWVHIMSLIALLN